MQRYRNNRRNCAAAKSQKLKGLQLPHGVETPVPTTTVAEEELEDYQEDVEALRKLFEGKATVASSTAQSLLDATRPRRTVWFKTPLSIREILETYPVFTSPKWVWHD